MTLQPAGTTHHEASSSPPGEAVGCAAALPSGSQRRVDTVAVGLAKIAADRSLLGICPESVAILSRLPSVAGVAVIRRDERRLPTAVHSAVTGMRTVIGKLRTPQKPAPSMTGPFRALVGEIAPSAPEPAGLDVDFQDLSGIRARPRPAWRRLTGWTMADGPRGRPSAQQIPTSTRPPRARSSWEECDDVKVERAA